MRRHYQENNFRNKPKIRLFAFSQNCVLVAIVQNLEVL